MARRNPLLIVTLISSIVASFNGLSETVSTGPNESPWMWMSPDRGSNELENKQVLGVVDVLEPDLFTSRADHKSEPRFIGHLKRKLCRLGLGVGKRSPVCFEDENSSELNRVKRSADERSDDDDAGRSTSSRFFGNGLDGLLNPHISPSFGVHFGHPYGYGYHGGYNRGYNNPFSFNLGPISINPFGGLRVSFRDGRPLIRPTLDFHVTPNIHRQNYYPPPYNNYDYHNRYTREAKYPLTNDQPAGFASSAPILHRTRSPKPVAPLKLSPALPIHSPVYPNGVKYAKHPQVYYRPINRDVIYSENNKIRPSVIFHEHKHKHTLPYLGLGKSLSSTEALKDDREDVFRKENK